jgi:hypothetical protein
MTTSNFNTVPAMTHASLDFVGVVSHPLERKGEYRFFGVSVTVYVGKDKSGFEYESFTVACALPPGERWKHVEPWPGRSVQVQGDFHSPIASSVDSFALLTLRRTGGLLHPTKPSVRLPTTTDPFFQ